MAIINIDDAYILDETGAQVDKVTGLFTKDEDTTSGEKAFAQLNIGTAGSNRNLLDNPWFTVNQRGFTSGSQMAGYTTVDRWKVLGGTATYTKRSPYGITINCSADYAYDQIIAVEKAVILGKTVTVSVMVDGVVYSGTGVATNESYSVTVNAGIVKIRLGIFNAINTTYPFFRISGNSPWGTANIDAVKLELGSVSTLANDAPPDYGTELLKCQRYFVRIKQSSNYNYFPVGFGANIASSATRVAINTPVTLKETGTVTVSYSGSVYLVGNGAIYTVSGMYLYSVSPTGVLVGITTTTAPPDLHTYTLSLAAGAYIDISADL